MDLQEVHNIIRFYVNKFQMGWFTPGELDSVLDRAQLRLFAERFEPYAIDQHLHDSLLPFKSEYVFTNGSSPGGLITLPSNYLHLLAVQTNIVDGAVNLYIPAEIMNEAQISYRRTSQLIPISVKAPVALLKVTGASKQVQLYPDSVSAGIVYYLRRPAKPVFAYSVLGRVVTYNSGASTQLEWDELETEKIIMKTLGLLGINLQASDIIQIADMKDKEVA